MVQDRLVTPIAMLYVLRRDNSFGCREGFVQSNVKGGPPDPTRRSQVHGYPTHQHLKPNE